MGSDGEDISPINVRHWMEAFRQGDTQAVGQLVEHFYPELRRMASLQMRFERPDHTLQTTALVNELYLQLIRVRNLPPVAEDDDSERKLFLGLAGFIMKRLLIHHARPLRMQFEKLEFTEELAAATPGEADLLEVEEVLNRLGEFDPVLLEVVQMRVFEGLSREQIAGRLNTSVRTVARHWEFARRWLSEAMPAPRGS